MCGITGFFSYKNQIDPIEYYDAHLKIAHRGPDDEGFIYQNDNQIIEHLCGNDTIDQLKSREHILNKKRAHLILGHRRLSIIDLTSHGHQPFAYDNLYLVYNGEIFNYIELREELEANGYRFETQSDTEVFLKAYHFWKEKAFNKFNGMWAAAIYNSTDDNITLTRDRFGVKPLYYAAVDNNLIFGSEIKFIASFFEQLHANKQMVYEFLRFNRIDHTNQTLFENILQIEPGTFLKYSKESLQKTRYWNLADVKASEEEIETLLKSSIAIRMRSDVEVGSLLSGGIDSSTILGLIDSENLTKKFKTFSAVFQEEKFSEKTYIDEFHTKNIALDKRFIYPKSEDIVKTIDDLIYTQEEPFRSLAVFSQYEIYKYIKNNTNTTVLLNGQGADEIFTGYTTMHYVYLVELLRSFKFVLFLKEFNFLRSNKNMSVSSLLREIVKSAFTVLGINRSDKYGIFNQKFKPTLMHRKFADLLKNELWSNLTFSALREYLRYEDKNSMRFSLESRLPFMDYRLVQNAFSLENNQKIKNGISKYILRKIAKHKIPDITLNRKDKMGFISPQEVWQKTILKEELNRIFHMIEEDGIFDFIDSKKITKIYNEYQNNTFNDWAFIWRIYCLYQWKKIWNIT